MIPLVKSTFYNETKTKKELTAFIKKTNILSFSKECEMFEKKFSTWQGRTMSIFLNSGSSANLALIQSLLNLGKIKKGDLVGFSSVTWATNTMPLIQLGLQAIPIDIELDTLNISSKKLIDALEKYPLKMLFITNLLGFCDDIDQIKKICDQKKIILIEDNCESLGTIYKGKKLGNFGLAATFSFYVGHHMSTIEGGCVSTDNTELADMLRIVRAHGWDRNLTTDIQVAIRKKHNVNSTFYSRYTFYDLGYNMRPTEITGFLGNTQLRYIDEIIKKRKENFHLISQPIYNRKDLYYPIQSNHIEFLSNFAIPIICRSQQIRDMLVEKCKGKIEIRPIVGGDMALQPFFKKYFKKSFNNPNARIIHTQGLYFGNNPDLTKKEIKTLIQVFKDI